MADTKISDLSALTALAVGDLLALVDVSDTSMAASGTDKKVTLDSLAKFLADWRVIDRESSLNDVVNVATEQTLYSVTVPANILNTERGVRLTLLGDYLNNSGAARTLNIKVKFGATTIYDDTTGSISASATRREFQLRLDLFNQGATNDQVCSGNVAFSTAGPATTGRGDLANAAYSYAVGGSPVFPFGGDSAEDTTADKALAVTVTHSTNNANLSVRRQVAVVELV